MVVKAMKNPRSALCKTSIMASSDIFKVFGDQSLDSANNAFDNLVRTGDFFFFQFLICCGLHFDLLCFLFESWLMLLDCNVVAQLLQLLLKASQDKRFVCEEADKALNAVVKSMTPLPLLNKLRPYVRHINPRIRAKAAITISNSVSKMVKLYKAIYFVFMLPSLACEGENDI
jgi:hypothetical protein